MPRARTNNVGIPRNVVAWVRMGPHGSAMPHGTTLKVIIPGKVGQGGGGQPWDHSPPAKSPIKSISMHLWYHAWWWCGGLAATCTWLAPPLLPRTAQCLAAFTRPGGCRQWVCSGDCAHLLTRRACEHQICSFITHVGTRGRACARGGGASRTSHRPRDSSPAPPPEPSAPWKCRLCGGRGSPSCAARVMSRRMSA